LDFSPDSVTPSTATGGGSVCGFADFYAVSWKVFWLLFTLSIKAAQNSLLAFRRTVWYCRRVVALLLNAALTLVQSGVYYLNSFLPFTLTLTALAANARSFCRLLIALSSSAVVRAGVLLWLRERTACAKSSWQRSGTVYLLCG